MHNTAKKEEFKRKLHRKLFLLWIQNCITLQNSLNQFSKEWRESQENGWLI